MTIKQSVINTFNRHHIPYLKFNTTDKVTVYNRFTGIPCETTPLIAYLISWVYQTSNAYEMGINKVRLDDFDRIRYFIAEADNNAYMNCID